MKAPAFQFYPGDWLRDSELQMACAASRGVWSNLLQHMWFAHDRGKLQGTAVQLAKLGNCTPGEFAGFVSDIESLHFGNIEIVTRNGTSHESHDECDCSITVVNRRMEREERARQSNAIRQDKYRHRHSNDNGNSSSNGIVTPSSASSSSTALRNNPKKDYSPLSSAEPDEGAGTPAVAPPVEVSKKAEWKPDDFWLRDYLQHQTYLPAAALDDPLWWDSVTEALGGVDIPFLNTEFAKMDAWAREAPARRNRSPNGWKRFVRTWLNKAIDERAKKASWQNGQAHTRR